MSARVDVRGLSKAFGGRPAVRDVSLVLEPGTTTTLVGPSGSGKTTLLRCLAGLLAQDAGEILFDGRSVSSLPAEKRGVGFVFQSYALFAHLSVADNIGFGLDVRRAPRLERDARVEEVAASLGLSNLLGRRPAEISGGERQRVALGRAIAYRPVLLLLDEPLAALDPNLAAAVREVLVSAIARERTTVLFVTHDRADALRLGDRIVLMREGKIAESGTPEDVYRRPRSAWAANFFGEGVVWNLHATPENGGAAVVTPFGRVVLPGAAAGPLQLVVRPEAVRPAGPEGAAARVVSVAYEGDRYRVGARFEGGEASLEWPAQRPVRAGDVIRLGLEPSLLVVLPGHGRALSAEILPAEPRDFEAIAALLSACGLPLDGLADHLAGALVARSDERLEGCVALELYGGAALLRSLAVAPERRGEGLGLRLARSAVALARARGAREVFLLTETAAGFFPRLGFEPVDRAAAPPAVRESVEFRSACPAGAALMRLALM